MSTTAPLSTLTHVRLIPSIRIRNRPAWLTATNERNVAAPTSICFPTVPSTSAKNSPSSVEVSNTALDCTASAAVVVPSGGRVGDGIVDARGLAMCETSTEPFVLTVGFETSSDVQAEATTTIVTRTREQRTEPSCH